MTETAQTHHGPDTYYLELRILGTVLDHGVLPDLEREDFQNRDFQIVWGILGAYSENHGKFDYVLIGDHVLRSSGVDKRDWFQEIWDYRIDDPALFDSYCENLRRHRDKGQVEDTITEAFHVARETDDPAEAQDRALETLRCLSVRKRSITLHITLAVERAVKEFDRLRDLEIIPGIPIGIPTLDGKTGGWQKSNFSVVAARPGVGKTALMCNFILSATGKRIGLVSTEQPALQITHRLLAIAGEIEAWKFRNPKSLTDHDLNAKLVRAIKKLDALDLHIFDATSPSVGDIEREMKDSGIDILFVDYAQRVIAPGDIFERVTAVAKGLKNLARNFDIPVISLAQINRQGSKNAGLEHLKGSGSLEEEADEVYILECGDGERMANLTLQKNRHGPTGNVSLVFEREILRFREAAR